MNKPQEGVILTKRTTSQKIGRVINPTPKTYRTADTLNAEGFPAWTTPDEEYLEQILMTNTLGNTFYVDKYTNIKVSAQFLEDYEDAESMARLIVKGRNEGFIRTINILALVYLMKKDPSEARIIFNSVIRTGNDMKSFIDFCNELGKSGSAKRKAIRDWLKVKVSGFYAMKYGNEIVDAINVGHPSMEHFTKEQVAIMDFLKGKKDKKEFWDKLPENLQIFEQVKTEKDEDKIIELITNGRLDYSTVVGAIKPSKKIWKAFAEQMGVFALLRHLATLDKHGLIDELQDLLKNKLTVKNLNYAKVFPFRLYQAYKMVNNQWTKNLLADVMNDYTIQYNFDAFGKTCIAPDVSYSMSSPATKYMKYQDISGMIAGFLYKGIKDSIVVPFESRVKMDIVRPRSDSVLTHIQTLGGAYGGTALCAPVDYLYQQNIRVDTYISITDTEEWIGNRWGGGGWLASWKKYKTKYPKAKAFLLRIDHNNTSPFSEADKKKYDIYQIYGWNDNVIKYMLYQLEKGKETKTVIAKEED